MRSEGLQAGLDQRPRTARETACRRAARPPHHAAGDGTDLNRVHARAVTVVGDPGCVSTRTVYRAGALYLLNKPGYRTNPTRKRGPNILRRLSVACASG